MVRVALAVASITAATLGTSPARAEYPDRPIHLVVGFAAGGPSDVLARAIGQKLQATINSWAAPREFQKEDSGFSLTDASVMTAVGSLLSQPATLGEGVILKEYQRIGISWLNLLYEQRRSCILADEMGILLTG